LTLIELAEHAVAAVQADIQGKLPEKFNTVAIRIVWSAET